MYTDAVNKYKSEVEFFHSIAAKVRSLVIDMGRTAGVAQQKARIGDYATHIDIAVEQLIVKELAKQFPEDAVLAEEGHFNTAIGNERIWIIDPICGTTNLARGIMNYCTNIALSKNKELVASCVIDHSQNDYVWSAEGQPVYINNRPLQVPERPENFGIVVDVNCGSVPYLTTPVVEKYSAMLNQLLQNPGWLLSSMNTSLSFMYVATGKIDGVIAVFDNPWDICAASFLIQQAGGVITDLKGQAWSVDSTGFIAAGNKTIHNKLLDAVTANNLQVPSYIFSGA